MPCKPWGTEITALGSPLTFVEPVASITAAMNQRARKAFGKHSKLWCAPTPLKARIKTHTTLVRNAALWASQSWPVTETLHKAVNSTQLRQLRTMLGDRRSPGGLELQNVKESQSGTLPVGGAQEHLPAKPDVGALWAHGTISRSGPHAQMEEPSQQPQRRWPLWTQGGPRVFHRRFVEDATEVLVQVVLPTYIIHGSPVHLAGSVNVVL